MLFENITLSHLFGIIASCLVVVTYTLYFFQARRGTSIPSITSWFIWVVGLIINAITYTIIVDVHWGKSLIAVVTAILLTSLFIYLFRQKKFAKFNSYERKFLWFIGGVLILWLLFGAREANVVLQIIMFAASIPTIKGLWTGRLKEAPPVWVAAVLAYVFSIASIIIDFKGDYTNLAYELAYPFINGILGNGSILILSIRQYLQRSKQVV